MSQRLLTTESLTGTRSEAWQTGAQGTVQTLRRMAQLVREAHTDSTTIRYKATILTRTERGHDFKAKADRLFEFVRDRILYQRDPVMGENVQDARLTLTREAGDCDDKAVLLSALLAAIGIRSRFVVASYDRQHWQHVYLEALIPQPPRPRRVGERPAPSAVWVNYDPTPERALPGWEAKNLARMRYGIFGTEADQIGFIPQLIMAGVSIGSALLSKKKEGGAAGMTDVEIAAAVDSYTDALKAGKLAPEDAWQQALAAVRAPGGGQLTVAASQRLWDLKESRKAGATAGGGSQTSAGANNNNGGGAASASTDNTALYIGGGLLLFLILTRS